mmetsp:Transcript_66219/g.181545  ORF Transcript_66219/g.181545 Transcript_66219/m.181545 type:complete len:177 (+) Transcript_66219:77-607(+)
MSKTPAPHNHTPHGHCGHCLANVGDMITASQQRRPAVCHPRHPLPLPPTHLHAVQRISLRRQADRRSHMPNVRLSFGVPHCDGSGTALLRVLLVLSPSCRHMPAFARASVKRPSNPNPASFQCTVRYRLPVSYECLPEIGCTSVERKPTLQLEAVYVTLSTGGFSGARRSTSTRRP